MTTKLQAWENFTTREISELSPLLKEKGIVLLSEQPHISGERFLMSGKKVVLVGKIVATNETIIIKSTTDEKGCKEIQAERTASKTLKHLPFAYHPLLAPEELWCVESSGRLTVATQYIEQPTPYLSLPLLQQFDLVLSAFTMLEGVHATTASHANTIKQFGIWNSQNYLEAAAKFVFNLSQSNQTNESLHLLLKTSINELVENQSDIERYCGFLTHDDFALHNFRFKNDAIYLIDQSSLKFGNKHESWARFLNYMLLYNRDLETTLLKYTKDNLSLEEQRSVRLLRIYKLIELISYHAKAAEKSTGNIKILSIARLKFWEKVLKNILENKPLDDNIIFKYQKERDLLRSPEEIDRQRALQQLV